MMKSICYFIEGLYNSGGMERVLSVCANALCKDYNITIVTINQKQQPIFFSLDKSINLFNLGVRDYYDKRLLKSAISDFLMTHRFDIVVSLGGIDFYYLHFVKDGSKKIVWFHFAIDIAKTVWVGSNPNLKKRIRAQLQTWKRIYYARKYDKIVVLTKADYYSWRKVTSKVVCIYNPVTVVKGCVSNRIEKSAISVGRLDFQKGYDYLIEAWRIVNREYPDWHLDIFGEGTLRVVLQRQIDNCQLSDIISLRGRTSDVVKEYQNHSLFVMSSRAEGFPLVLLEAASYGLPLISYACPTGPDEIIDDEVNGFLVRDVGDVNTLAEKIMVLIENDNLRETMGNESIRVSRKFDIESISSQWKELYNTLS